MLFNRQLIHDVINQACVPPPPPPPSPAPARRVKSRLTQGREGESRQTWTLSDDNLENVGFGRSFGGSDRQPNTQDRKAFTKIELGPSVEVSDAVNVGYRLLFPQRIVVHRSTMSIGVEVSFLHAIYIIVTHSLQVRVVTLSDNQCMYPMSMSRAPS